MNNPNPEDLGGLRKLFPELTLEELKEADERMWRHPAILLDAYERIGQDPVPTKALAARPRKRETIGR